MKDLKWRRRTAIVGYIDVILALIGIIGTIVSGVAIAIADNNIQAAKLQPAEEEAARLKEEAAKLAAEETEPVLNENETISSVPISPVTGDFFISLTIIWVAVGFAVALSALQLVAAIKMLKATEANYHPLKALCPARFWLCVNVILILVSPPVFVFVWGPLGPAGYGGGLIIRMIMIYIVYRFKQELVLTTAPPGVSNKHNNRIGPI